MAKNVGTGDAAADGYKHYLTATGAALPICENLFERALSLPMSGYIKEADRICSFFRTTLQGSIK